MLRKRLRDALGTLIGLVPSIPLRGQAVLAFEGPSEGGFRLVADIGRNLRDALAALDRVIATIQQEAALAA